MNGLDIKDLWYPALRGLYGLNDGDRILEYSSRLEAELGTTCHSEFFRRDVSLDFPMAEDSKEAALIPILKALAGPHAKTLLKVYKIQRGKAA